VQRDICRCAKRPPDKETCRQRTCRCAKRPLDKEVSLHL